MTTEQKCKAIIEAIVKFVNEKHDNTVTFSPDWGGNSLTIAMTGLGHNHCGLDDESFDTLVEHLYNTICNAGPHLSWA
jgi:hypothetical protein